MKKGKKKWYGKAVKAKTPNDLGGWSKSQDAKERRRKAIMSRPKNWTDEHRARSAGQALNALANVTKDKRTEMIARRDARHFFKRLK